MEEQVRVEPVPFSVVLWAVGVRGAWPPPGGCGRNSLGLCSCSTSWSAKASPYSLGVRCMRRAGQHFSRRRARPPALVDCVARSCFVGLTRVFSPARSARLGRRGSRPVPQPLV